jgi:hypothetical protein
MSLCPRGWVCHAVRAPGSKVTAAPAARAGSFAEKRGAIRTVPVNQSAGPSWFSLSSPVIFSCVQETVRSARCSVMDLSAAVALLLEPRLPQRLLAAAVFVAAQDLPGLVQGGAGRGGWRAAEEEEVLGGKISGPRPVLDLLLPAMRLAVNRESGAAPGDRLTLRPSRGEQVFERRGEAIDLRSAQERVVIPGQLADLKSRGQGGPAEVRGRHPAAGPLGGVEEGDPADSG